MKYQECRNIALANPYCWLYPSDMKLPEKVVLLAILYLGKDGLSELSHNDIANYLQIETRTLKRIIDGLKERKIVKVIRKMLGNIYVIQWENEIFQNLFENPLYDRIGQKELAILYKIDYINIINNINYNHSSSNSSIEELKKNLYKYSLRPRLLRRNKVSLPWYDSLIKEKEPLPEKKPPLQIPYQVKSVMQFWKYRGLHVPKETSKSYRESLLAIKRLLGGRLFDGNDRRRYSVEEIKESVSNFSNAAFDPDYEPADIIIKKRMAKTYFHIFVINRFSGNGRYSEFLYYLKDNPKKIVILEEDVYPAVTDILRKFYFKQIVGKTSKLSTTSENKFRRATKLLMKFMKSKGIRSVMRASPAEAARMLCDCTLKRAGKDPSIITPGWFCSDTTFEEALPAYFKSQGMIEESTEASIYDNHRERDITMDDMLE